MLTNTVLLVRRHACGRVHVYKGALSVVVLRMSASQC